MKSTHDDLIPIYTIGYGKRSIEELIEQLNRYGIQFVVDIRSAPYSRYKPEFSKDALEASLDAAGIRYVFMGDLLGGRPSDPSCFDANGKVDYESVKTKEFYQKGIARIQNAFDQQQTLTLMCSEGKPDECHRSKLIGVSLEELGIPVLHIDENGNLKSQQDVMVIVMPQPSLFEDFAKLTSRKKYAPSTNSSDQSDDETTGIDDKTM